jgi:hydrogenase-4 component F
VLAIAGMPPFGVFMSEFLVVTSTFARSPVLALLLVLGLLLAFGALLLRLTGLVFGEPEGEGAPQRASILPLYAHMALVLIAGLHMPWAMVQWFQAVAKLLG